MSMHLLLLNPHVGYVYKPGGWKIWHTGKGRRSIFPGTTLPYIAALAKRSFQDLDVQIVDENVAPIDIDDLCSKLPPEETLIGLTGQTIQIVRAYELADAFRLRGYKVMIGGIHASLTDREEVLAHVDTLVSGEADEIVSEVIADFQAGSLQREYVAKRLPSLDKLPRPLYELLPLEKYFDYSLLVQTTRGCVYNCEFCSVKIFNGSPRYRPVQDVIEEIKGHLANPKIRSALGVDKTGVAPIFFVDDHFCTNVGRAMEMCQALIKLQDEMRIKIRWTTQMSPVVADNKELLDMLSKAGCTVVFLGFESLSEERLKAMSKGQNKAQKYLEQIEAFRQFGIDVFAAWIVGFEGETPAERLASLHFFRDKANVYLLAINPLTPLVGTPFYQKMKEAGKLREDIYWLSKNVGNRLLPLKFNSQDQFSNEYWELNSKFYNLRTMAKLWWRGLKDRDSARARIFSLFFLNSHFVHGVMSS